MGNQLEAKGEKTKLSDYGSQFAVGKTGIINQKAFAVLGRIRFAYTDGFWDEWLIQFEQEPEKEYWLQEDEGDYTLFEKNTQIRENPNFYNIQIANYQELSGQHIFFTEKSSATITGGEGELPHMVVPGQRADFADGIVYGLEQLVSFEFLPAETVCYTGFPIELKDIQIH